MNVIRLGLLVSMFCLVRMPAHAEELWNCTFVTKSDAAVEHYLLKGEYFVESGTNTPYSVVLSNSTAIIAIFSQAWNGINGPFGLRSDKPVIELDEIIIDRNSSNALKTMTSLYGPNSVYRGTCHMHVG